VVVRYRERDQQQVVKVDYYLSNAAPETPLWEFAQVTKAEHRIEECLQQSRVKPGGPTMRYAIGWAGSSIKRYHCWRRGSWSGKRIGEKMDTGNDVTADSPRHRSGLTRGVSVWDDVAYIGGTSEALAT